MPIFILKCDELIIAQETNIELESHLEDWLENSPRALTQEPLLWIGKQASATVEERTIYPDLLGIDSDGNLIILELKRDRTPRDVVAQLLEYTAWANELTDSRIHDIAETYFETRNEFRGMTFSDAFRQVFDMSATDELPTLNQVLRLFIAAGEIPPPITSVCRFLRTSHGMDIICIEVSVFQIESNEERLVSMEVKVGHEDIGYSKTREQNSQADNNNKSPKEILWKIVKELTTDDPNTVFTQKCILNKSQEMNKNTLRRVIIEDCVNGPPLNDNTIINPAGRYWWVSRGKYRLYDPERDNIEE